MRTPNEPHEYRPARRHPWYQSEDGHWHQRAAIFSIECDVCGGSERTAIHILAQ